MRKLLLAVAAVTSMVVAFATATVAQTVPPNLPAAIMCYAEPDQSWRVGYLSRVNKNGDAEYISANGKLSATLNAKGAHQSASWRRLLRQDVG